MEKTDQSQRQHETDALIDPVAQTVESIAALHQRALQEVDWHQRSIEKTTDLLGRPAFLHVILVLVLAWITYNLNAPRFHYHQIDPPPFYWMQGAVSLSALLMTVAILITQTRQGKQAERRAHLDLQVNLVAEQKIAKLIALLEELRRDIPSVQNRHDPEAEAMTESTDPAAVMEAFERSLEEGGASG